MSPNEPLSLNLNAPPPATNQLAPVPVEQLQFRQAELLGDQTASRQCAACKQPIRSTYFQIMGKDACERCAAHIQSQQQTPSAHSLLKAALYGGGAAIAGCVMYALVAILVHLELALLAILIGYMVGKAVRHGSNGLGGRPQQILAVLLTYFAITFSYLAVFVYHTIQTRAATAHAAAAANPASPVPARATNLPRLIGMIVLLATIAPFLTLSANVVSGAISLFIIFVGLRRAWALTGRTQLEVFGPYSAAEAT